MPPPPGYECHEAIGRIVESSSLSYNQAHAVVHWYLSNGIALDDIHSHKKEVSHANA